MSFCVAVTCIDGRVQVPVIRFLQEQARVDHVDLVTEPGVVKVLAESDGDSAEMKSIHRRIEVSRKAHRSRVVALVAHEDCAGNPVSESQQLSQLRKAARRMAEEIHGVSVMALWADLNGRVTKVVAHASRSPDE